MSEYDILLLLQEAWNESDQSSLTPEELAAVAMYLATKIQESE